MAKSTRARLEKKLDTLWSLLVRRKYPACIVCGKTEGLNAHHCIKRKAQSKGVRWLINNGVSLCWDCHFNYVHGQRADKPWWDRYIALLDKLIPKEEQEKIIQIGNQVNKFSILDLETLAQAFKEKLDGE